MRTVTCSYHCSDCGSHFSSLGAFDAHRRGDYTAGRYCEEPLDVPELGLKSETSVCTIAGGATRFDVRVHALQRDLDNWGRRGASDLVRKPSGATETAT